MRRLNAPSMRRSIGRCPIRTAIYDLKRQKLRIKDEISQLERH